MADHNDLIAEMPVLEQMGTQERQKLAKKRRLQQLKKWGQREKEYISKEKQLNKRLANKLNEENNGLNLKQYSIYDSNGRTNKLTLTSSSTSISNQNGYNSTNHNNNPTSVNGSKNNNNHEFIKNQNNSTNSNLNGCVTSNRYKNLNGSSVLPNNNNNKSPITSETLKSQLVPNGRVHFNVGVMLLEAAARNDFDEVKRLLMLGVSPDSINHDGLTALHQCCIDASEPMMNLLLEFGANVDARDTEQWTPLHAACTCGHLNLVKVLVEHGADLLAVNGDGNMPFDICEDESTLSYIESQMVDRGITQEMIDITRASTEMQMISDIEKLVSMNEIKHIDGVSTTTSITTTTTTTTDNNNKKVNILDEPIDKKNNVTFLHIAAANGYSSAVKFLLKHGVNVDACDNDLWRPLHGAACWGTEQHAQVIELLIESGAQLDAKTINDETVFDLCDNAELLEKLNEIKDDLESKKAATGSDDRLKRTQSRTNSRIHSVRRTSVRDKNQISRREAREEALLRVENSPIVKQSTTSTCTENNEAGLLANGVKQIDIKSFDEIDYKMNKEIIQTDLDDENITSNPTIKSEQSNNSSAHSSSDSIVEKNKLTNKRKQLVKQASLNQDSISISIDPKATPTNSSVTKSLSTSTIPNSSNKTALMTDKKIKKTTTVSLGLTTNNNSTTTSNTACDLTNNNNNLRLSCPQTSTVVLIAPNNYTLSNLKKQRSDLRMRTSSIGGGIISNTTTNTTSNGISLTTLQSSSSTGLNSNYYNRQKATSNVLDNSTETKINSNGLKSKEQQQYRPESPSTTFRKFSGEPSETVGGRRNNEHKCCIVM